MKFLRGLWRYWMKVRRARRIKSMRDKLAPYLKKDFGVELNYKLWTTKGARFIATERNSILNQLSTITLGTLSAYLIIINLFNVYDVSFIKELSDNELGFATTSLSILILIFSQFESASNFAIRSEKFHQCAMEISELYNELRMLKTFKNVRNIEQKITVISIKYEQILKKYENHKHIDFDYFMISKPKYFELNLINVWFIKFKYYYITKVKYHVMIYGPVVLYIYYQIKNYNIP